MVAQEPEQPQEQAQPVAHSPVQPQGPGGGGVRHSPVPGQAAMPSRAAAIPNELPPETGPDPSEPEALEPEELSVSAQKEAANDGLFDVFDRRTVQCLFSKTWALREQALHSIAEGYADLQCEKGAALRGTCYVLRRVFQDRIAQVFSAGSEVLEVALNGATGLRRADVADYVKVVLGPLLLKLADTNQRVKQTARDALMLLAQNQRIGPAFVGKELVGDPKVNWKQRLGRLEFLADLVAAVGIDAESPHSFGLEMVMPYVVAGLKNPNNKVRSAAVEVAGECYAHVQLAVEDHMTGLSAAQVETLHAKFQKVDQYGGRGPEPSPQPQRAPARAPAARPPSGGGGRGGGNEENIDPFAAAPKVRNSFESSGSGARPPSRDRGPPVQNSPAEAPGSAPAAAPADDGADPFASKPRVRNSFDLGAPPRAAAAPAAQPVQEAPNDYSMPAGDNPFETRANVRNSVAQGPGPSSQQQHDGRYDQEQPLAHEPEEPLDEEDEIPAGAAEAFERGTALFEEDKCDEAKAAFSEAMEAGHPDVASCLTERGRCAPSRRRLLSHASLLHRVLARLSGV